MKAIDLWSLESTPDCCSAEELEALRSIVSNINMDIINLKQKIDQLKARKTPLETYIASIIPEIQDLTIQTGYWQGQVTQAISSIASTQAAIGALSVNADALRRDLTALLGQLVQKRDLAQSRYDKYNELRQFLTTIKDQKQAEVDDINSQIEGCQSDLSAASAKLPPAEQDVAACEADPCDKAILANFKTSAAEKDCVKTKFKFRRQKSLLYNGNWVNFYSIKNKGKLNHAIASINKSISTFEELEVTQSDLAATINEVIAKLNGVEETIEMAEDLNDLMLDVNELFDAITDSLAEIREESPAQIDDITQQIGDVQNLINAWAAQKQIHVDKLNKLYPRLCMGHNESFDVDGM